MPHLKSNGIGIYYEVHGAGEPLLLIMGLGANATAWELQLPAFSREYQVITFDNRGAGRSEKPAEPYSIHQMAEDAAGVLDALGIHSAHVFGMSMGGMIAQELAVRHPERVRTLILGGTMCGGPMAVLPKPAQIQQFVGLAGMPATQAIEMGLSFLYSEQFLAANKERLVQRAITHLPLLAPPHALQKQVMAVLGFNVHGRLKDVRAPALILHGTDDKIVPFANAAVLERAIPDAQVIEYPGAGHGFLVERADDVNAAVLDFLRPHRTHFVHAG